MKNNLFYTRKHYIMMVAGVLIITLGYLLMIGGGSENPNEFSEEIFSFRRISLSPIVIIAGFAVLIYTVMYRPRVDVPESKEIK